MNKKGFTLLELLVVVLIIGILAGIALPQYRKAVAKAELAQVINATKALRNAQERFYLANGSYTTNWNNLDIDLPEGNVTCRKDTLDRTSCYSKNYSIAQYYSSRMECYARNQLFATACESLLGKKADLVTSGPCANIGLTNCYVVKNKFPM